MSSVLLTLSRSVTRPALLAAALVLGSAACVSSDPGVHSASPAVSAAVPFQVKVVGHGPPMLLLPGLASSGEVWDGVVAHYQDKFECHVFTLAGFAGVPTVDGPLLSTVRPALAAYIRDKHLEKPVVVGHSLGGVLALWMAEQEPELLGKLVIVDSLPFLPASMDPDITAPEAARRGGEMQQALLTQPADERRVMQRMSVRAMVTDPAQQERVLGWGIQSDVDAVAGAMAEIFALDLRPDLSRIRAPALVVGTWVGQGARGSRASIERTFHAQYAGLEGARVVLNDKARHFVMLDDLPGLLRETDPFLATTGASPAPASSIR